MQQGELTRITGDSRDVNHDDMVAKGECGCNEENIKLSKPYMKVAKSEEPH